MFDSLTDRLTAAFRRFTAKGALTEADVDAGLREVRLALLEADVQYKVARDFIARIRSRAVGVEVLQSLTPGQQVIKLVHDELVQLLGGETTRLTYQPRPPTVILLLGLQGAGKTTTTVKLALLARREGHRPLCVAADLQRPAAVEQLRVLATAQEVPLVGPSPDTRTPAAVAARGVREAERLGCDVVLVDSAGRLHLDEPLLEELRAVRAAVPVGTAVLVVDAMTGQEAVNVATAFRDQVGVDGVILTKLDSDARGGAALSMRAAAGLPILLCGVGERPQDLEPFHPDRMARRILGMGDVVTLVERAQAQVDREGAAQMEERMMAGRLTLDDFIAQLRQLRQLGSLESVLDMVPGGRALLRGGGAAVPDEGQLRHMEAMVLAMTPAERRRPEIIDASRRRRIAAGSGTTPPEVSRLVKGFAQMQGMMRSLGGARGRRQLAGMLRGGGLLPGWDRPGR